uniref:Uncharacterized protein n=1 Tax=Glossina austeni TaxID=7395 RepID=A0A1A9UV68_GLOAU
MYASQQSFMERMEMVEINCCYKVKGRLNERSKEKLMGSSSLTWKSISTSHTRTTACYCVITLVFYVRDTNLSLHKCFSYMGIGRGMSSWRAWEVLLSGTITRGKEFGANHLNHIKLVLVFIGSHQLWAGVFEHYLNV